MDEPIRNALRPSSSMTVEVVAAVKAALDRVEHLYKQFELALLSPVPESVAAVEEADRLGCLVHHLAASRIHSATDHLLTWRHVLVTGLCPALAHASLLRTAHETAWAANWLVEPGLSAEERRARGVAAGFADLDERRKAEEAMGLRLPEPPARAAADRQAELLKAAEQHGLTRLNRNGELILTTPAPSVVTLFDRYEPASPPAKGASSSTGSTPATPTVRNGRRCSAYSEPRPTTTRAMRSAWPPSVSSGPRP